MLLYPEMYMMSIWVSKCIPCGTGIYLTTQPYDSSIVNFSLFMKWCDREGTHINNKIYIYRGSKNIQIKL